MVSFSTIRAADDAGGHRARDGQLKIVQPVLPAVYTNVRTGIMTTPVTNQCYMLRI